MFDSKLKPWLLEVNVCPSLSSSSPFDKKIKTLVICDTFNTIGIQAYDSKVVEREQEDHLRKRVQHREDPGKVDDLDVSYFSDPRGGEYPSHLEEWEEIMEKDIDMFLDYEEEARRGGNFEQVFPISSNVNTY
jgi:hypothetical protein